MRKISKFLALTLSAMLAAAPGSMALADTTTATATEDGSTPLVIADGEFSQKFSQFYADSAYDVNVVNMFALNSLLTTDRTGGIIYNAIEGETVNYNGTDYLYKGPADVSVKYDETSDTTTYTVKIRDDIYFSDGEHMTADDIIFTYYVYLDPAYVGSTTLNSYPIQGLKAYRTQIAEDALEKYQAVADAIQEAGPDHEWSESDSFTKEQQESYWSIMKEHWVADVQDTVDYVAANYAADYAEAQLGVTADDINNNEGLKVAFGMVMWGFGTYDADTKVLTAPDSGATFDLGAETYPTIEDAYDDAYAKYSGSVSDYIGADESANGTDVFSEAVNEFLTECNAEGGDGESAGVPNISGITKLDDYTVQVVTDGYEAPAVYQIFSIGVAPLHYYGDASKYDYDNNMFGHDFGDLSIVESKTTEPMGAGPYKFVKYENRVVYFEANENYYAGAPKIKYVQFKESNSSEYAAGVAAGTVDQGDMDGSKARFDEVRGYNSNGELTGDVITTDLVDNMGYGYIGMNADNVKVGEDPLSTESKNLRKALATVLAVYRDVAFDSYYGDAASVINYPISNTSWAAPQPSDEGYKVAFSVDAEGNDIYTSEMTQDDKYAAALEAAKGFLIAAGYTFDETSGKFTAAPEGAKLSYEVTIGADGVGDHPTFAVLTDAQAALATIGIDLKINDLSDTAIMWDMLDAGEQELWCAAWQSTIDPDMYQVYYSGNIIGKGGSDSNHYHIASEELDKLILDARKSDDQSYRKAIYKQALDFIVDAAVEVPCYQRQNCQIFSTQRIDTTTITPDITTFWGWRAEIEKLEMVK